MEPPEHALAWSASSRVRRAALYDTPRICALLNRYPAEAGLLSRSQAEICAAIESFLIAEDDGGRLLGCCSLHPHHRGLAEVRSMLVRPDRKGCGIGGGLLDALLEEARSARFERVCLFTRAPEFFERYGFTRADIAAFPEKQQRDCRRCPRRTCCDEVAMVWTAGGEDAGLPYPSVPPHALYSADVIGWQS